MKPPLSFALCFNLQCPRQTTCLRYQAAKQIGENHKVGLSIYPTALQPNGECAYFRNSAPIKHAYGFRKLFSQVKQKDAESLRHTIKQYLGGHGTYYRYNRGEKQLTPIQQESILNIFQKYGYTESLIFDEYTTTYDFSE